MAEVIGVRFKNTGKVYYFDPQGIQVEKGSMTIVRQPGAWSAARWP